MESPGKLRLDGPTWLSMQQKNLYGGFWLAAVIEPLGILLNWVLVPMVRTHRSAALKASALYEQSDRRGPVT
jgi:hypothetical protein